MTYLRLLGAVVFAASCASGFVTACTQADPAVSAPSVDAGSEAAETAVETIDDASAASIAFSLCPGAYTGACASIPMPLDWSAPEGAKIGILIDKIASTAKPKRQLWLLQGGPGASAASLGALGVAIADQVEDTEVLTIEHRGVGSSNRLACADFEAAHPSVGDAGATDKAPCFDEVKSKHGDDLRFYTATNAARDLAHAIELLRRPGVPVFVLGASYGTYWAQRFLQVAPNAAAGVVLDSIVPAQGQSLSLFDTQGDKVAIKLAEHCKANASCTGALGPDPWARLQAANQKLSAGHCPESGLTPDERVRFTQFLQMRPFMGYAFALWHRFDRCTAEDAAAIRTFLSKNPLRDPNERLGSDAVYANIGFSELWESPPPSDEVMTERFDSAVFPAGVRGLQPIYPAWPRYAADEHVGTYPSTSLPMLMLAGGLDAQTPLESQELVKAHYTAPNQTFVTLPLASHIVLGQSPFLDGAPGGAPRDCGFELLNAFLSNPTAPLDVGCATKLAPIEFSRPSDETAFVMGTTDLWLGVPVVQTSPPAGFPSIGPGGFPLPFVGTNMR